METRPEAKDAEVRLLEIGRSLTANLDLESLLRMITEAARDLTGAKYAALGILNNDRDELERFITYGIPAAQGERIGHLPRGHGVLGLLIKDPRPLRLSRLSEHPAAVGFPPGHPLMKSFLGVPILIDEQAYGNLYLTDKVDGEFNDTDESSVVTLAAWASIAIQNARSVRDDRLRAAIDAAEQERKRWARELHDDTLQGLGALHVLLATALRRGDPDELHAATAEGLQRLRLEITNLRSMIAELRPAALDQIGLFAALEGLIDRITLLTDIEIVMTTELEDADSFSKDLELTIYRIVQEATNNAVKHAGASRISVSLVRTGDSVTVSVRDDGKGFDVRSDAGGFGILGMSERAALANGQLEVISTPAGGTEIHVKLPVAARITMSD
ncbi:MAG: GAF domain-containing sensor histidine kinase [Solirubrobacterales bacterium]|nr:GAF domain-containing sensor histidine kinase [Solirubrobacterales bacterium]